MQIINFIYFIIISLLGLKFAFQSQGIMRHPVDKRRKIIFNGFELLWTLIFSTGLLALSAPAGFDLMAIRLLVLECFCLFGVLCCNNRPIWCITTCIYVIYLLWLIIGISYSPMPTYGIRVFLKYLYPFLILLFASAVVRRYEVFLVAGLGARTVALVCVAISFVPYAESLVSGVFWYGTARAINFITMCIFSLALYFDGFRHKKDLWFAIIFAIPCVLWVFRTSMAGTTLALVTFYFYRYKLRSIPVVLGIIALFICSIFFIPSVRTKMFTEEISIEQIREGKISKESISSNSRFALWTYLLNRFYSENKLSGCGTGCVQNHMYNHSIFGGLQVPHNDYVQMLCDNGIVAVIIYLLMGFGIIAHTYQIYNNKQFTLAIRICAITAGSSLAGVLLTMYTDNTVNYSMATLAYPFGFYGMMLGLIAGFNHQKSNNRQNDICNYSTI